MASQSNEDNDVVWGPTIEKFFIDILVDEVNKGNKKNGLFPPKAWKVILNELNQRGGRNFSMKQIKQKFNRLRMKHRLFSDLIQQTGFGWDAESNTVTAEDVVWDAYIAKRPEAHQFRKKGCEHYKLMGIIFNKSTATGVLHHASTMDPPNSDEEQQLENAYINTGVHINLEENSQEEYVAETTEHILRSGKRTITTHERKPKKDRKPIDMSDALLAWAESSKAKMEASLAKAERYRAKSFEAESTTTGSSDFSLSKCVDMLTELEDISDDVYVAALEKFKNQDWRDIFLRMPMKRKHTWLNRLV